MMSAVKALKALISAQRPSVVRREQGSRESIKSAGYDKVIRER